MKRSIMKPLRFGQIVLMLDSHARCDETEHGAIFGLAWDSSLFYCLRFSKLKPTNSKKNPSSHLPQKTPTP